MNPREPKLSIQAQLQTGSPEDWESLWKADPHAGFFQHPAWASALTAAFPKWSLHSVLLSQEGEPVGLLPYFEFKKLGARQIVSLPFGTYGGPVQKPLPEDFAGAAAEAMVSCLANEASRLARFEMTVGPTSDAKQSALLQHFGNHQEPAHTHLIDLSQGFDHLWNKAYDKETRTCVRKAEREGVTVSVERGGAALDELHRLYLIQSQAWGTAPLDREVLGRVMDALGERASLWIAKREGQTYVGVLTLTDGEKEIIPWVSGTDPEGRRFRASHILYNAMIEDACNRGYASMNFGSSAGNPGIEAFKVSFGAERTELLKFSYEAAWLSKARRLKGALRGGR